MHIIVSLSDQTLTLQDGADRRVFQVSTAAAGASCQQGSNGTPLGRHLVRARIGDGLPPGAVFRGRRFLGERYDPARAAADPGRDWILSRILWLGGLEPSRNQGADVDSFRRFIYIHGTPDSEPMGEPASHGCIRMRNTDVIALFARVPVATPVTLVE
ncbi:cell wall-recycling L,D-carboxypeptidase ElsL [Alloalcanivorax gelatiniphagus]|uniref:L,D-transpeptidase n=2 Tax=Alloalcanivorax gelatiniphagus TaxID=1194167 RepID=A0ABY2XPD0_9GAMM|nr:L,D-transpeptidase [Alloalcanivorax gelatiniphagus]TMW14399.1 L,D-transpeptidase [Alloalcanivorax gelatiniphagus]